MNHIDLAPLGEAVPIKAGKWIVKSVQLWARWFNQVVEALDRPTITESITFPNTADGAHSVHTITFPTNTVKITDSVILTAPLPPSGTAFNPYITTPDTVDIAFENSSGAVQNFPLPEPFTVTILRN